jgi:hypothetical protein
VAAPARRLASTPSARVMVTREIQVVKWLLCGSRAMHLCRTRAAASVAGTASTHGVYQVVAGGEDVCLRERCHEWERVPHPHRVHV